MNNLKQIFLTFIILFIFIFVGFFTYNTAESKAYDFMTKTFLTKSYGEKSKKLYGSDNIVLVVFDTKTVEKHRWPWKREKYCEVFNYFLKYADEKVVIYDSIITTLDNENPESDKKFFETVNQFDNLVVGFLPRSSKKQTIDPAFAEKFKLDVENKLTVTPNFYKGMMPFPQEYRDVTKYIGAGGILPGFINGNLAPWALDEIYRNQQYIVNCGGNFYPSLATSAFMLANNIKKVVLTDSEMIFPEINKKFKHRKTWSQIFIPTRYYKLQNGMYSHKYYSAIDIMDSYNALKNGETPKINPEVFKNKFVVIGANVPTSTSLNDNKNTPISINHPGVDIQATAIDNLVNDDFLTILPQWFNLLITLIGIITVYLFIRIFNLYKAIFLTITSILLYIGLCGVCYYYGIVISVLTPIVLLVLTMILSYTHKFVLEHRSKEKVKTAMGKYMSEDVMKRVVQNIDNLGLGGKKATVTVLFSDIRGFTTMSEQMTAQQVSEILNEYFTEMEPIITEHNGIINKFIGDAIMAVFGEPIQDKNHAQNAVKCACKMLDKVKELQKKWANENKPKINIGIGINTGEVFVGNIGSVNRMEYTVIGDTVNLASRLESYNKTYKTKLLISSSTYEEVKNITDTIKISDVQIRGKANKMDIYEVLKIIN
ncbi:adenylate/guanylate cyclase domain-containing protein [bacterium]|nr:adenylate/guanylate cyclase domain-containing protein [bacterium]